MKTKFTLTILIVIFAICKSIGQAPITIEDVLVNSQTTIDNCSLIDLGSTANNNLNFYFKLTKLASQTGNVTVDVLLKYSSSTNPGTNKGSFIILENQWTNEGTQFESSIPVNVSAVEIQDIGSSIYLRSKTTSNIERKSCEYPLERDNVPTFKLTPSSKEISCGSTSPINFYVDNVYSSPGNVIYTWTIGSGWNRTNGTPAPTTIVSDYFGLSLVPSNYPPGDISVTPKLDNVNYPTLTSSFSLKHFYTGLSITGPHQICTTSSYNLALPNDTSVIWNVSDTSIATVVYDGNQATLTAVSNGIIKLTATLKNACGQTSDISKTGIKVGRPTVTIYGMMGGHDNQSVNSFSNFNVTPVPGATQYYWHINKVSSNCSVGTQEARFTTNQSLSYITALPYASVSWNQCPGTYVVNCWARNSCGDSPIGSKTVIVYGRDENPCDQSRASKDQFTVFPNPIKGGTITIQRWPPGDPCNGGLNKSSQKQETLVTLFNSYGTVILSKAYRKNEITIDGLKLESGFYIIEIMKGQFIKRETLVVK